MSEVSGEMPPGGVKKEIVENPQDVGANTGFSEPVDSTTDTTQAGGDTYKNVNLSRLVTTTMVLTYISALAVSAEYSGYNDVLPEIPEMIASSMGHPAVGYLGGGAAGLAAIDKSPVARTGAILAGATMANLFVEKAQSVAVASPEFVDFLSRQNLPETAKDYAAALLGAALVAVQLRRK